MKAKEVIMALWLVVLIVVLAVLLGIFLIRHL